ncbi:diguanylate cyclase [Stratiformator vulcanicus]|uniref:diguanylate cyclase n=1 Tax=Stratiformator vulcanicus TaxID=2527980 RepID=A0A517QWE8_9PLAN|nr:diguanylate cyclase [Stratiformator vulcanicus]QDT35917.1 putative diguanylate cyclase YedQ [Stratiformator vulcanicus]
MKRSSATIRICLGLTAMTVSIVMLAVIIGLVPDGTQEILHRRATLCETIAIKSTILVRHDDTEGIKAGLKAILARNPDMLSAGIRHADGTLLVEAGPHSAYWMDAKADPTSGTHMSVPIHSGGAEWGDLEARFAPVTKSGGILGHGGRLGLFVGALCFVANFFYLRRVLKHLDPSRAVPDRVRDALNTLAEGVVVIDSEERIMLANESFSRAFGLGIDNLVGCTLSMLSWTKKNDRQPLTKSPWSDSLKNGTKTTGDVLEMTSQEGEVRTLLVNCAPIFSGNGTTQGVLASFDDITPLEKKKAELRQMLLLLQKSSDEIKVQNEELERLANVDPLTSCLNRRSFFERFAKLWKIAETSDGCIACIMLDIDHFKSVNDNHGHAVGDEVIKSLAGIVHSTIGKHDLACRYGGEEFCIVMPNAGTAAAADLAERIRFQVENTSVEGLTITSSFGVASLEMSVPDPEALVDLADQALYAAKKSGRNRVVTADNIATVSVQSEDADPRSEAGDQASASIPFDAVTALFSALAYRDHGTAEHSRRVADLAVALSDGLMSSRERYILEVAALLHDIGKIGVPDAILLKPGPLTSDEWELMRAHDRIGTQIIATSFKCEPLKEIVRTHHAFYGDVDRQPGLPVGTDIPLGARILTICDSYDAIVSDRVYRKARSREEAFQELRRCAGSQFDPVLVERLIEVLTAASPSGECDARTAASSEAIGMARQVAPLMTAVKDSDLEGVRTFAEQVGSFANKEGMTALADRAVKLEASLGADSDLLEMLGTAHELLDLCKTTQRNCLDATRETADVVE